MGYDSNDFDDGSIERCPHCGGSGNVMAYGPSFTKDVYFYVVCEDCGAMSSPTAKTSEEAVEKWNRRTAWDDYPGNPDYDPRKEDHRGGLQPASIIRHIRFCAEGNCDECSLNLLLGKDSSTPIPFCRHRLMLAAADTIEHLLERERRRHG